MLGNAEVGGDTVFDLGSITKVFTALALSEMVQRGEVALDDPAQEYLPADVHLHTHGGRQITLADLARYTSGFPWPGAGGFLTGPPGTRRSRRQQRVRSV